jgi:phosphoribosylformylglycinamidine synthase subunit PurQ / glutaminase
MKFGVIVFPGSNCDQDMVDCLQINCGQEVVKLWHKNTSLEDCEVIVLPGGFSYGDYLRSGAIARFSPIMNSVIQHAEKGGMVFGICNGFQILTEAGLLPGALLRNEGRLFNCKNVFVHATNNNSLFTRETVSGQAYKIPVAHAEGRYFADEATLDGMQTNGQILYKYCNEQGVETPESNPNGSVMNIAGVSNKAGNVFGMMPHPERAASDIVGNKDGLVFFHSILQGAGVLA